MRDVISMASGPETRMHPMASPLGGGYGTNGILVLFYPAYFYSAKIMVSLQKREMVIQLMGFYRNFVQIDNG